MSSWWDVIAAVAPAVVGAVSNKSASNTAQQGYDTANQITQASKDAGVAAINAGKNEALSYLGPEIAAGQPATTYLRTVMAQPTNRMTPAQQIDFADTTRNANANLARSGLRGAGRSGVATVNEAQRRAKAGYEATNTGRSDAAAGKLYGTGVTATAGAANLADSSGKAISNTEIGVGTQQAKNSVDSANVGASSGLATGKLVGDTIGKLSSVIAADQKAQDARDVYRGSSGSSLYGN